MKAFYSTETGNYAVSSHGHTFSLGRAEMIALRDQIGEALYAGMLAERARQLNPLGLFQGDKVLITDMFLAVLRGSEYAKYGSDVWERASREGELTINLRLGDGDDHLRDAVGIYNPYFGKSIYVIIPVAQAMKAAYVPPSPSSASP